MHPVTTILLLFSLFSLTYTAPSPSESSLHYSRQFTGTQTGYATWYGVGLGACGVVSNDAQYVVAISSLIFYNYPGYNGDPSTNPVCGKQIEVSYQGRTVTVTILDSCTACATTDVDLSPGAFDVIANTGLGRIGVTWTWL